MKKLIVPLIILIVLVVLITVLIGLNYETLFPQVEQGFTNSPGVILDKDYLYF